MKKTSILFLCLVLLFSVNCIPAAAESEWVNITDVVCVAGCTVALRSDGRVLYTGDQSIPAASEVGNWSGIERIETQNFGQYLVGFRTNGEVFLTLLVRPEEIAGDYFRQIDVSGWTDVRKLVISYGICLGLRYDGSFYWSAGDENTAAILASISNWPALADIGTDYDAIYGLDYDGCLHFNIPSVQITYERIEESAEWPGVKAVYSSNYGFYAVCSDCVLGIYSPGWNNVESLYVGSDSVFGLRYDGTVAANFYEHAVDDDSRIKQVNEWTNIVQLGFDGFMRYVPVGLRSDGTIAAVTTYDGVEPYGCWDFSDWSNVKTLFSGTNYTIGLRGDGSLLVTGGEGLSADYLEEIKTWNNVKWIYAEDSEYCEHIVALCHDGTLLAAGNNSFGQCNVS